LARNAESDLFVKAHDPQSFTGFITKPLTRLEFECSAKKAA